MRDMIRIMLLLLFFLTVSSVAEASPVETVETYHSQLLATVSSPASTSDQARYDSLSPTMDAAFDFESMIKTAAGTYWREATPEAQAALLAAFRRVSIATYADQFADPVEVTLQTFFVVGGQGSRVGWGVGGGGANQKRSGLP